MPSSTAATLPSKKISPANSAASSPVPTPALTCIAPSSVCSKPFPRTALPPAAPPPSATSANSFFSPSPAKNLSHSPSANSTTWPTSRFPFSKPATAPTPNAKSPQRTKPHPPPFPFHHPRPTLLTAANDLSRFFASMGAPAQFHPRSLRSLCALCGDSFLFFSFSPLITRHCLQLTPMLPAPTNHFPATPIIPALTRNSGVGLSPACATFRATSFANFCQRITIQVLIQTISARRPNPAPNFPEFPPPASPATPAPCQNESRKVNLQD